MRWTWLVVWLCGCGAGVALECPESGELVVDGPEPGDLVQVWRCGSEGYCFEDSGQYTPDGFVVDCTPGMVYEVVWR